MKRLFICLFFSVFLAACGTSADPFMGLEQSRRDAERYAGQLTATADSRIFDVTETAAAFLMIQTQTAYPYTVTAMAWTPTPIPTSTPDAKATMEMAIVQAEATVVTNEAKSSSLKVDRQEMSNAFWAAVLPILFLAGLLVLAFVGIQYARQNRKKAFHRDEKGDAPIIQDLVTQEAFDLDRSPNFSTGAAKDLLWQMFEQYLERKYGFVPQHPRNTAARQDAVTERDQNIDLRSRTSLKTAAVMKLLEEHGLSTAKPEQAIETSQAQTFDLFPLPAWELVNGWNRDKDSIPLGNSHNGLEYWDLRNHPHLAVFGMTRSGKDRRCLRPLVTLMLASGQHVVLIGKETDFLPFIGHPNALFLPIYDITDREEAMKYADALTACVDEKNRRIQYMAKSGLSLWNAERTFIVLDELGNAMLEMDNDLGDTAMRKARSMVNEAGKAGMSLVFSAQRPKGFVDLTTQCGRVAFQVENNQERRYALGINGSDRLPEIPVGYFYKKFRGLQVTGGFEPSDDEIRAYLSHHQVRALPKADWIDGVARSVLPTEGPLPLILPEDPARAAIAADRTLQEAYLKAEEIGRILDLSEMGKTPSAIVKELWDVTAGTPWVNKKKYVEQVLRDNGKTTTTSGKTGEISAFSPEMA